MLFLFRNWRSRKNPASTPPPPLNRVGSWRSRKISATTPPPHWIASASGDHGKDSRNSTTSTWQLCCGAAENRNVWICQQKLRRTSEFPHYDVKSSTPRIFSCCIAQRWVGFVYGCIDTVCKQANSSGKHTVPTFAFVVYPRVLLRPRPQKRIYFLSQTTRIDR